MVGIIPSHNFSQPLFVVIHFRQFLYGLIPLSILTAPFRYTAMCIPDPMNSQANPHMKTSQYGGSDVPTYQDIFTLATALHN